VATEEDLLRMPNDGPNYELVDGRIRGAPPGGGRHARVCVRLVVRLGAFVEDRHLGYVFGCRTGFRLPGGNVRVPDACFVALGHFPNEELPEGFGDEVPELAVEVLGPGDGARDILDKLGEYLDAGVQLVWVIDPKRRAAAVYKSPTNVRRLGPEDSLDGEDALPGFRCRLADVID
jgi:Uma2 family endonuclease